jgi:hypothetical protein
MQINEKREAHRLSTMMTGRSELWSKAQQIARFAAGDVRDDTARDELRPPVAAKTALFCAFDLC